MTPTTPMSTVQERIAPWGHPWPGLPGRPAKAVVGVDGSESSLHAVDWALRLANEVHLVHGMGMYRLPSGRYLTPEVSNAWVTASLQAAKEALAAGHERTRGHLAHDHAVNETPAFAILDVARDVDAGLVTTGHAGRNVLDRLVVGSVSEQVAHRARVPALVAKGPPVDDRPILVGLGADGATPHAVAWAARIGETLGVPLVFAHAVPDDEAVRASVGSQGTTRLVSWPPKAGLAALAEREDAQLVVVGHGHRPGWLGSTAVGVVRSAPCSVLVVHRGIP